MSLAGSELPAKADADAGIVRLPIGRRIVVEALEAIEAPVEILEKFMPPRALELEARAGAAAHVEIGDHTVGDTEVLLARSKEVELAADRDFGRLIGGFARELLVRVGETSVRGPDAPRRVHEIAPEPAAGQRAQIERQLLVLLELRPG